MKIILEQTENSETQVIIKGDLTDQKVQELIKTIQAKAERSKLFLLREDREYLYDAKEVSYFEADKNKVTAHIKAELFETRFKIYELAQLLSQKGFVQISKGIVININEIYSVEAEFSGNYVAVLKDKCTRLIISRKYLKAFRQYVMEA